jgi:hypothetical protein
MASKGQKLRILEANDCYVGLTSGKAGYVSHARDEQSCTASVCFSLQVLELITMLRFDKVQEAGHNATRLAGIGCRSMACSKWSVL